MTASALFRLCVCAALPAWLVALPLHAQPVPGLLLERAIKVAGGAKALQHVARIAWEGEAVVHAGGRIVTITGGWQLSLPDSALVVTRRIGTPELENRVMQLAGESGRLADLGSIKPMPPGMLASERDAFWAYELMRLVPLRDSTFSLRLVPGDSVEWKALEVTSPGRPTAEMQFNERAQLRSITMNVHDEAGQGVHRQRFILRGVQRVATPDGDARWFETLEILKDGAPFFTLTTRNVRLAPPKPQS